MYKVGEDRRIIEFLIGASIGVSESSIRNNFPYLNTVIPGRNFCNPSTVYRNINIGISYKTERGRRSKLVKIAMFKIKATTQNMFFNSMEESFNIRKKVQNYISEEYIKDFIKKDLRTRRIGNEVSVFISLGSGASQVFKVATYSL